MQICHRMARAQPRVRTDRTARASAAARAQKVAWHGAMRGQVNGLLGRTRSGSPCRSGPSASSKRLSAALWPAADGEVLEPARARGVDQAWASVRCRTSTLCTSCARPQRASRLVTAINLAPCTRRALRAAVAAAAQGAGAVQALGARRGAHLGCASSGEDQLQRRFELMRARWCACDVCVAQGLGA